MNKNTHLKKVGKTISKDTYSRILNEARQNLSQVSRLISKIIHIKLVDYISNFIFKYIFRANSILLASIISFLVLLSTLLMTFMYNYKFSGFEMYLGFIVGWMLGYLYDLYEIIATKIKKSVDI